MESISFSSNGLIIKGGWYHLHAMRRDAPRWNVVRLLRVAACIAFLFLQWGYRAFGQTITDLPRVFRELQSEKTTKNALHEVWVIYSTDRASTRDFLAQRLPRVIAEYPGFDKRDPTRKDAWIQPREAWRNNVDVAATFKIIETVPALAR